MSFTFSVPPLIHGSDGASASAADDATPPQTPIDPSLLDNEIPMRFIDTLANQFGFGDQEKDLRHALHGFAKMSRGLQKPDIASRSYLLAAIFSLVKENRVMRASQLNTQHLLTDLQIRLEATFGLSPEQKANIRIIAGDSLLECNRITFMFLHLDVEKKLREDQKNLKFTNVYGNPAREKFLMSQLKRTCSNLRNTFREMLRDSVIGNDTCTLKDFVYETSSRFRRNGGNSDLGYSYSSRLAILRRFAYEHSDLLDRAEEEEEQPSGPSDDSIEDSPPKKRRRRGGRCPKGQDFWSQVEAWFEARQKQWGNSWATPGWKGYIQETLQKDEARYTPTIVNNPFMEDVEIPAAFCQEASAAGLLPSALPVGQFGDMDNLLRVM